MSGAWGGAAGGAPEGEVALRRRRAVLMEGLAASLRLDPPAFPAQAPAAPAAGTPASGGSPLQPPLPSQAILPACLQVLPRVHASNMCSH